MSEFAFILRYVDNPAQSADFYASLLGAPVVEQSPTFAMLPLRDGVMLGLWIRSGVEPKPTAPAESGEIAFVAGNEDELRQMHRSWTERGIAILQQPTRMDFGLTFVAADPDGHRLRALVPDGP